MMPASGAFTATSIWHGTVCKSRPASDGRDARDAAGTYLVGLDCCNLLVLLHKVANRLIPLLQCAFADRLGHRGDLDDLVGVRSYMLELHGKLAQRRARGVEREFGGGASREPESSVQHVDGVYSMPGRGARVLLRELRGRRRDSASGSAAVSMTAAGNEAQHGREVNRGTAGHNWPCTGEAGQVGGQRKQRETRGTCLFEYPVYRKIQETKGEKIVTSSLAQNRCQGCKEHSAGGAAGHRTH